MVQACTHNMSRTVRGCGRTAQPERPRGMCPARHRKQTHGRQFGTGTARCRGSQCRIRCGRIWPRGQSRLPVRAESRDPGVEREVVAMRFGLLTWSVWFASAILCPVVAFAESGGEQSESVFLSLVLSWAPIVVLIGIWAYFMRSMRPGQVRGQQFMVRKEQHMERVEQLLGEISTQLGRIARSTEARHTP